ncbi:MAG: 2-C-methyl-D-erythritol 4-phosphate cytidylyltransferase [Candidatus Omnitrophica bacterium]|nr:2-C-methyl-D-erythritol 4-phosphate cytidylyltransferase [Candidatus Omnitrophota bacterium]
MKVTAIIPAAGYGRRMRSKTDKPFIMIHGKEMLCHCLNVLEGIACISEIIIAAQKRNINKIKAVIEREGFCKVRHVIEGGSCRGFSVANALKFVNKGSDFILVHDCARPIINKGIVNKTISAAKRYNCAVAAVRAKSTIKQAFKGEHFVDKTLDRSSLWEVQTPQVFKADILKQAYKKAGRAVSRFTDDSGIVEYSGNRVRLVQSTYANIKITTAEDLVFALFLKGRNNKNMAKAGEN